MTQDDSHVRDAISGWQVMSSDPHHGACLTSPSSAGAGAIRARLCSWPSADAIATTTPSQDVAILAWSQDGTRLAFCVCDGVSSSYFGGFAAHVLAERFTTALITGSQSPFADHPFPDLEALLAGWARAAQTGLRDLPLPLSLPRLARAGLEDLRDSVGSETVFLAGWFDARPDSGQPGSEERQPASARAWFCWMGNVAGLILPGALNLRGPDAREAQNVYAFGSHAIGPHSWINQHGDDANRWSTVRTVHGHLSQQSLRISQPLRIAVYTDGALQLFRASSLTHGVQGAAPGDVNALSYDSVAATLDLPDLYHLAEYESLADDALVLDITWHAWQT